MSLSGGLDGCNLPAPAFQNESVELGLPCYVAISRVSRGR
ncbi:hypothetical protein PITC_099840 [Penicillium italicum]|uniref:Uncharacterized protein n=1 Tax=Penicillium italicum TaxID=40296 RepID=A0A0A2L5L4_PENIT|nr:hypothetical protein PITC_099840 [Penicillium italicum]